MGRSSVARNISCSYLQYGLLEHEYYIPPVFCLVNNKTAAAYKAVLCTPVAECAEQNLQGSPAVILADFEKAINIAVMYCYAHERVQIPPGLGVVTKNTGVIGLGNSYTDTPTGRLLGHLFGLQISQFYMV